MGADPTMSSAFRARAVRPPSAVAAFFSAVVLYVAVRVMVMLVMLRCCGMDFLFIFAGGVI